MQLSTTWRSRKPLARPLQAIWTLAGIAWIRWLIIGLVVRLILMPITMHNDTVWMPWMAYKIVEGHWNVYQYLFNTYGDQTLHPVVWAPYMPLYYLVTAAWTGLLKLLGIVDVGQWSFDTHSWYIPHYLISIFMMKALYLPFDCTIGWAVSRMVRPGRRAIVWAMWALSPVTLVSVYMMGQNDLMPTTFVVLATLIGIRADEADSDSTKRRWLVDAAALLLGVGAAFKSYPLFLILPFALVLERRTREIARFTILAILPFIFAIAPFLSSHAFRLGVLLNPEAQRIFATVPGLGPAGISPFVAGYVAFLGFLVHGRGTFAGPGWDRGPRVPLPVVAFAVLGLMFATTNWAFYWLVWLTPFFIWSVVQRPSTFVLVVGYMMVFLVWTWNWGNQVSSGLFSPIDAGAVTVPAVRDLVNQAYPWGRLIIMLQSAFLGLLACNAIILLRPVSAAGKAVRPAVVGTVFLGAFLTWIAVSFAPALIR